MAAHVMTEVKRMCLHSAARDVHTEFRGIFGEETIEALLLDSYAEVVSPSTVSVDRAIKSVIYAEAGIPVYWRVELHDTPRIVACSLSRGRYVTRTTLVAGTPGPDR